MNRKRDIAKWYIFSYLWFYNLKFKINLIVNNLWKCYTCTYKTAHILHILRLRNFAASENHEASKISFQCMLQFSPAKSINHVDTNDHLELGVMLVRVGHRTQTTGHIFHQKYRCYGTNISKAICMIVY